MKRKFFGILIGLGMCTLGGFAGAETANEKQLKLQALNWEWQYIQQRAEVIQREADKIQAELRDMRAQEMKAAPEPQVPKPVAGE